SPGFEAHDGVVGRAADGAVTDGHDLSGGFYGDGHGRRPEASGAADGRLIADAGAGFFGGLAYIGQLLDTYLVCQAPGELVLIDQHAAHERVAYERLRAAHGRREMRRQRLLFPVPVPLDEAAAAAFTSDASILETLGFEIEAEDPRRSQDAEARTEHRHDDRSAGKAVPRAEGRHAAEAGARVWVRAVPELLKDADPKPLVQDVLAEMVD